MRIRTALVFSLGTFCVALSAAPMASAQSFFQKMFGASPSPIAVPGPVPRMRAVIPHSRFQSRAMLRNAQSRRRVLDEAEEVIGPPDSGGPYKTMCVRTCDGFYFPLRHNARRKNFASDAKSCRNACGSQGKLFYYPLRDAAGPDAMVDLAGHKYAELATAFAYRKKLMDGCACKPDPWSYEEARRHQSYADQQALDVAETEEDLGDTPANNAVPVAAVAHSDTQSSDDPFAGDAFSRATPVSMTAEGSVDLATQLSASVGKTEAREGLPASDVVQTEPVQIERPLPQRSWRRRTRAVLHRTSYGYVPTRAIPAATHMP